MGSGWWIDSDNLDIYPNDVDGRIAELMPRVGSDELDDEELLELAALRKLKQDVKSATGRDWAVWHAATIVHEDGFTDYARNYATEIADLTLVESYVDWERFARDLKGDGYSTISFDGATYYVR